MTEVVTSFTLTLAKKIMFSFLLKYSKPNLLKYFPFISDHIRIQSDTLPRYSVNRSQNYCYFNWVFNIENLSLHDVKLIGITLKDITVESTNVATSTISLIKNHDLYKNKKVQENITIALNEIQIEALNCIYRDQRQLNGCINIQVSLELYGKPYNSHIYYKTSIEYVKFS